jgi:hypothetical protein
MKQEKKGKTYLWPKRHRQCLLGLFFIQFPSSSSSPVASHCSIVILLLLLVVVVVLLSIHTQSIVGESWRGVRAFFLTLNMVCI